MHEVTPCILSAICDWAACLQDGLSWYSLHKCEVRSHVCFNLSCLNSWSLSHWHFSLAVAIHPSSLKPNIVKIYVYVQNSPASVELAQVHPNWVVMLRNVHLAAVIDYKLLTCLSMSTVPGWNHMYVYVYTPCKWCALIRSNSYPSHPCSRGKPGTCIAAPPEHQNGHCMPVHVHKTRQEPTLISRLCMRPRPFPVPVFDIGILQAIKNWSRRRPGNEATYSCLCMCKSTWCV